MQWFGALYITFFINGKRYSENMGNNLPPKKSIHPYSNNGEG